jgi:flavin reductase (DIM6/NTAB) family NADH-FMN oxidoreductase RutF
MHTLTDRARPESLSVVPPDLMRRAMGRFVTGVSLVMAEGPEGPCGMTINSLTWISREPPIVLISLTHGTRTADAVNAAGAFSVNILGRRHERLAQHFAQPGGDRFAGQTVHRGESGQPVVPNALSHLECVIQQQITAGDHTISLGLVTHASYQDGDPLIYYSGRFGALHNEDISLLGWP